MVSPVVELAFGRECQNVLVAQLDADFLGYLTKFSFRRVVGPAAGLFSNRTEQVSARFIAIV